MLLPVFRHMYRPLVSSLQELLTYYQSIKVLVDKLIVVG